MFTNLLFLILVLLIVNIAPEASGGWWEATPENALFQGLLLYAGTLAVIAIQNFLFGRSERLGKQQLLFLTNCELICFLLTFHFVLAAHRFYEVSWSRHTLFSLVSLLFYFGGLFFFHYTLKRRRSSGICSISTPTNDAANNLRFILPFAIPFLLFGAVVDFLFLLPFPQLHSLLAEDGNQSGLFIVMAILMACLLIFMPLFMVRSWQCAPLPQGEIRSHLEALCKRANFRCRDLMEWQVMRHSLTAAIIGVVAPFRYILFTNELLHRLPRPEIEAILAHEIGHSRHRHLLIYPFIISGTMVVSGLFFFFFGPAMSHAFSLNSLIDHSPLWRTLYPLSLLVPTALILGLYFRLVFGYFSRLFERQADIHPLSIGIAAEDMIAALDSVAVYSGNTHTVPSWHHWSIQQRIDFLESCRANPQNVAKHHKRVRRALCSYFLLLLVGISILALPYLPEEWSTQPVGEKIAAVSRKIDRWFNQGRRERFMQKLITKNNLNGDPDVVQGSLRYALQRDEAIEVPGIAEFYGAQLFIRIGEAENGGKLMTAAWRNFDFFSDLGGTAQDFERITEYALAELPEGPVEENLLRAMIQAKYQLQQRKGDGNND